MPLDAATVAMIVPIALAVLFLEPVAAPPILVAMQPESTINLVLIRIYSYPSIVEVIRANRRDAASGFINIQLS